MATCTELAKTEVQDRNGEMVSVKVGDNVNLLPASLRKKKPSEDEDEEFFFKKHQDFLREYLGPGPYMITWIYQWPCGRIMLSLKTSKSEGAGCYAENFVVAK